jgi:hypothetical protein
MFAVLPKAPKAEVNLEDRRPIRGARHLYGCTKKVNWKIHSSNPFKLIWPPSLHTKVLLLRRRANQWFLFARFKTTLQQLAMALASAHGFRSGTCRARQRPQ